jgi:hypothetical protein
MKQMPGKSQTKPASRLDSCAMQLALRNGPFSSLASQNAHSVFETKRQSNMASDIVTTKQHG